MKHLYSVLCAVGTAGLILSSQAAFAQQLEEVVVIARKKEENLQDVPIAIDVFTAEQIERQGITQLDDVVRLSSSLQYQTGFSPQDTQITIRGLSPERGRVNAAVLLDGVDITSEAIQTIGGSMLINPELFDIERIEVVKGPQNALYGRSAFAGAISYITKRPSQEFYSDVGLDVGSDGQFKATGRVSGPLAGETLAGDINAMYYTHDGFYDNEITGADVGGRDGYSLAGSLAWEPVERLSVLGRLTYSDDEFEVQPWSYFDPNVQYPIPQSAIDSGVVPGFFPIAGLNGDVATLLNIPGLLPLIPGQVPGPGGTLPSDDSAGFMSEDPRTCSNPFDQSTCGEFPDGSREVTRAQLNIDWEFGENNLKLSSITHYADSDVEQHHDGNTAGSASTLPFLAEVRFETETELLSQELRLQSQNDGPFNWTVGGLYWDEEVEQIDTGNICITVTHPVAPNPDGLPPFIPPLPLVGCGPFMADIGPQGTYPAFPDQWFRDTTSWSAYFLVDWEFIENWTVTLEGRYVDEDLDIGGPDSDTVIDPLGLGLNGGAPGMSIPGCVEFMGIPGTCLNPRPSGVISDEDMKAMGVNITEDEDDFFVPKITLRWNAADNQMYYVSVAQAAKPSGIAGLTGGIGAFNPDLNQFEREERTVYEFGGKTDWLDGRVILNGAIFFDDYDDKQVGTQVPDPVSGLLTTRTENAAEAEVFGIELEAQWAATENLTLGGSYTYLDTEWTDFEQLTGSTGTIAYGGNCRPITTDAGETTCGVNFSGNELENAPENAFVGYFNYTRPFRTDMSWFIEGDAEFMDDRFVNPENSLTLDSYWLFNFRAGVQSDRWEVVAYVDNAFDDDTIKMGFDSIDTRYLAANFIGQFTLLVPDGARYMLPDPRSYGIRATYRWGE